MLLSRLSRVIVACAFFSSFAYGQRMDIWNGDDLESYVSRPDLRPPKFTVLNYKKDELEKGYWFTAPYNDLLSRVPTNIYQPSQVGPHIYDDNGELVWSGASHTHVRNVFDFKLSGEHGGGSNLTYILDGGDNEDGDVGGVGVIMDNHFNEIQRVHVPRGARSINMHEFTTIDNGRRAIFSGHNKMLYDAPYKGKPFEAWVLDLGFFEVDVLTGKLLFEWWAADHVHPLESTINVPHLPGSGWDWFHINAVDKFKNGDYLVSARHCNTIYRISGTDGHIIWKLGGKDSSIDLLDFDFSSQHDARVRSENSTHTVISFLNNASDGVRMTADFSSAMLISIDRKTLEASLIRRWDRPDGRRTNLRGNVQLLPNANVFVGWSANSYISEFAYDGRCLMEAYFSSQRFSSYRTYKFNFTGVPAEAPALKTFAYGTTPATTTTVYYVSWNGATEVAVWRFYKSSWAKDTGPPQVVGEVERAGFETIFMAHGYHALTMAEALDRNGRSLRNTTLMTTEVPKGYERQICGGSKDKDGDGDCLMLETTSKAGQSESMLWDDGLGQWRYDFPGQREAREREQRIGKEPAVMWTQSSLGTSLLVVVGLSVSLLLVSRLFVSGSAGGGGLGLARTFRRYGYTRLETREHSS